MESKKKRGSGAARLLAVMLLLGMCFTLGCGGAAGVDYGAIRGKVYGNASGGSANLSPLSGVSIIAQKQEGDGLIRTAVSDANGDFVISNLPVGEYLVGYAKEGFKTITTAQGDTNQRTAIGDQIRVYIEPGQTAGAPDVNLRPLAQSGDSTIVITLLDKWTGKPVNHATITIGAATTSNGGSNGTYTLSVPVTVNNPDAPGSMPNAEGIRITADGYNGDDIAPTQIIPIANETLYVTVQIGPNLARIAGFMKASKFESLYNYGPQLVDISSDILPVDILRPNYLESGYFYVFVPASNKFETRQVNLTISSPLFHEAVVSNIVVPQGSGTRELTSPVMLNPKTVDLVGTVADSNGGAPNQLNPFGIPDTVVVKQTGQTGNIVNGAYTIPAVPVLAGAGGLAAEVSGGFTLVVSAYNPNATNPGGGLGVQETTEIQGVKPTSDGTANPIFVVPHISLGGGS